jgi:hypothetical protein
MNGLSLSSRSVTPRGEGLVSAMLLYRPEGKTMKVKTDVKSGLVVIAIIAVLIGMLVPDVKKPY